MSARIAVARTRRRATYQDVLNALRHRVAEIVGGTLHTSPRPAPLYARASSGLSASIAPPFDYGRGGPGGWWIIDEPEPHLSDDIVVPDLAGWQRESMPVFPNTAYFTVKRTGFAKCSRSRPERSTKGRSGRSTPGKELPIYGLSIPTRDSRSI